MNLMEDLSQKYKLPSRSISAVHERFATALTRHQNVRKVRFRNRNAITAEAMINAIVLRFLDLGFEDQAKILAAYVPRLEKLMEQGHGHFDTQGNEHSAEDFVPDYNTDDRSWEPADSVFPLPEETNVAGKSAATPHVEPAGAKPVEPHYVTPRVGKVDITDQLAGNVQKANAEKRGKPTTKPKPAEEPAPKPKRKG